MAVLTDGCSALPRSPQIHNAVVHQIKAAPVHHFPNHPTLVLNLLLETIQSESLEASLSDRQ